MYFYIIQELFLRNLLVQSGFFIVHSLPLGAAFRPSPA
jgi:hypothetical protein